MTSMINKKASQVLSQFTYTYDANGNITSVNDGFTNKKYVYDKLNRLIEVQHQNGDKICYSYDYRGNRRTEVGGNFNLLPDTSYSYDQENRLKTVTKGISTIAASMSYYADGMRAKKESPSGVTNYIYNLSGKLVAEAENSSTVTSNYIWGPNRVLAKKNAGGEYYYLYNGHGDVVQMIDRNGNIVNNYEYDEWGNILYSKETVSNPFKYAGEVYDQETGLYYLRARYYDPTMGRFLNEDSYEGQVDNPLSLNLYTYCYNEPLGHVDPSGHIVDVIADVFFFGWDIVDIVIDPQNPTNWAALGADATCTLVPFATGGGRAVKAAAKGAEVAKDVKKAKKAVKAAEVASKTGGSLKTNLQFFAVKGGLPAVKKAVNSNLPHAVDRAVERGVFNNSTQATNALKKLSENITRSGFPSYAILDTAYADRVLVPVGNNGMAVYQVAKNGSAKLKTILIAK